MSLPFKHDPLNLESRQIRLLRFVSDNVKSSRIHLDITHHNLNVLRSDREPTHDSRGNLNPRRVSPRYWALSYTWGPEHPLIDIYIDGKPFSVRRNLYTLLNALKHGAPCNLDNQFKEREGLSLDSMYFWVDQICIDQNSTREKNHQVEMMRSIYQEATSTIIWLGPKGDVPGCEAIMAQIAREKSRILQGERERWERVQVRESDLAREDFYNHPYWTRLWVVQEIMYSRQLLIMCGIHGILWEDFADYYHSVIATADHPDPEKPSKAYRYEIWSLVQEKDGHLIRFPDDITAKSGKRRRSLSAERGSFKPTEPLRIVIETFGDRRCEDVRDKIFGLQSLVSPEERVVVDYSLATRDLFTILMTRLEKKYSFETGATFDNFGLTLMTLLGMEDDVWAKAVLRYLTPSRNKSALHEI